MHRGNKYLASLFLSAALMAPLGAFAMAAPQDDHERHRAGTERRVYDPYHKDYHNWDRARMRLYRQWLETRHEGYVDYEHLRQKTAASLLELAARTRTA